MCYSDQDRETFAKELLKCSSKTEAYRRAFPKRCKGKTPEQITVRASRLAADCKVTASVKKLAAEVREEVSASEADIIEIGEFRASLTRLFRTAARKGNVPDAVKLGGLLANVCGFNAPVEQKTEMTVRKYEIPEEELNAILAP